MLYNSQRIHALTKLNLDSKTAIKSYQKIVKELRNELEKLEEVLNEKLKEWQPELVQLVGSVIGIGKRATSLLIVSTHGFKTTKSYQQLISFAGLSPKEYSSGSSIRGKVRICKTGGKKLRNTLYMCALNAKKTNPACKELYDRLVSKGKNKKLAIIAVCNKLLKQVFIHKNYVYYGIHICFAGGVVKSGRMYDRNYALNLVNIA